jgi:hypothetical protein
MECPECKNNAEQLCMYGIEEEINIDYYCEKCGTIITLTWKPGKRAKQYKQGEEI